MNIGGELMANWEHDIAELLQEAQSIAVLYNSEQMLTDAEQQRARNNIDIKATVTNVSGNDYQITLNY